MKCLVKESQLSFDLYQIIYTQPWKLGFRKVSKTFA